MNDSKWPVACAVIAVAVAMALIFTPWDRIGPIDWNAISAISTLLAVIVAIFIPLWQNWDRRRELARSECLQEWANCQDAHRISARIKSFVEGFLKDNNLPNHLTMDALSDQLESLRSRTSIDIGRIVVSDLAQILTHLRSIKKSLSDQRQSTLTGQIGMVVILSVPDSANEDFSRIDSLHEMTYRWTERTLLEMKRLGLQPYGDRHL